MGGTDELGLIGDMAVNDLAMNGEVEIRLYRPEDAVAFRELNEAWIRKYFALEEHDREMLNDPEGYILRPGGGDRDGVCGGPGGGVLRADSG